MSLTIKDAETSVRKKIRDFESEQELGPMEVQSHIDSAVERHNKYAPREIVHEFDGDGSSYDFDLPSDSGDEWEDGFSEIAGPMNEKIEFPAGERIPVYIDDSQWVIYNSPTGKKFRMLEHTPGSTESVRYTFTKRHTLDSSTCTILTGDFDAVCDLAASFCLDAMAAKYSRSSDSTIAANSVNYRDNQLKCKQQSEVYRKRYETHVGVSDGVGAASVDGDFDSSPSWPSRFGGSLTHSRLRR